MNLNKNNCIREGTGEGILLAMYVCGIGDDIQALPAVMALAKRERVTVNVTPFRRPIWEAIGVNVISIQEPFGYAWYEMNRHTFGRLYSLHQWGLWQSGNRIEHIAEILDVELPETFSWLDVLRPRKTPRSPYVLLNERSEAKSRAIPQEAADRIEYELIESEHDVRRMTGYEARDVWDLINLIYGCEFLVTCDSAPAHIAAALGKKFFVTHGPTDARDIFEPYRKYIELNYTPLIGRGEGELFGRPVSLKHLDLEPLINH